MRRREGFTLTEMTVALAVASAVIVGVIGFFTAQKRAFLQEDISAAMDDALRIGLSRISDTLRDAGYGVPDADLALWTEGADGYVRNPTLRDGGGTAPDAIDIALCRAGEDLTLSATADPGERLLRLEGAALARLERGDLLRIGGLESARVVASGLATIVDTDPSDVVPQGLARRHFAGTPVCRVALTTFALDRERRRLTVDRDDGEGAIALLDDVTDLQLRTLAPGALYRVTMTVRSRERDPDTREFLARTGSAVVALRN